MEKIYEILTHPRFYMDIIKAGGLEFPGRKVYEYVYIIEKLDLNQEKLSKIKCRYFNPEKTGDGSTKYFNLYGVIPHVIVNNYTICSIDYFEEGGSYGSN